jgi:membrane fusion protein (multidrug efflux system)
MDDMSGDLHAPKARDTERDAQQVEHAPEDPQPAKHPSMRPAFKIALLIAGIIVLLAAIAYGIYWWTIGSYQQSTNDAFLQADQASVAPRISGYINEVLVRDNQIVTAGQVLARIDAR